MKLVAASGGVLINNRIGDNKGYNSYVMPKDIVALTDWDADNLINSHAAQLIGYVEEAPGISVASPSTNVSVEVIPRLLEDYKSGKSIVATPEITEILSAFGIEVAMFYPIEVPYIDIYTDSISLPNMEVVEDNNAIWADVEVTHRGAFTEHVSGMNGSKAMFWITNKPKVHPQVTLDIANTLSQAYDIVFICGNSDLDLDLYRGLDYNENVINLVGRIGRWCDVIEFADMCDLLVSPTHWLINLMFRLGEEIQVIGPCSSEDFVGVGGTCEYNLECNNCPYEFCPAISCINASYDDGNIVFEVGGV